MTVLKKGSFFIARSHDNDQEKKCSKFLKLSRDSVRKKAYRSKKLSFSPKYLHFFSSSENNQFFQLPTFYLIHPALTTLLIPYASYLLPNMWSMENAKTDLDLFLTVKMTAFTSV